MEALVRLLKMFAFLDSLGLDLVAFCKGYLSSQMLCKAEFWVMQWKAGTERQLKLIS